MVDAKSLEFDRPNVAEHHPLKEPDAHVKPQVLILDAGSQYGKLIDRRVRESGVRCDIAPLDAPTELLEKYDAFIISGGPASVTDEDARKYNPAIFSLNKPVLGICYGQQLMAHHFGGKVGPADVREDGRTLITTTSSPLFYRLSAEQKVIMSHGDSVLELPEGFEATAFSNNGSIIAAMQNPEKKMYAAQFHPEVTHTDNGSQMLENFLFGIANLEKNYLAKDKLAEIYDRMRLEIGDKDVECFVSGGLDSTVTAKLLQNANLTGRLRFVLVDNGYFRSGEIRQIIKRYKEIGIDVVVRREAKRFASATTKLRSGKQSRLVRESEDPQEIRQIIGDTFIKVRTQDLEETGWEHSNTVLVMGTLRPDLIESGSALASTNTDESGIKIHHNDTDDVRRLRSEGLVHEPLQELHKDEVREIAKLLGLPDEIVYRQPFPGPGLGVRILPQTVEYVHPEIDRIREEVKRYDSKHIGALILPLNTVGVQGDRRTYSHALALTTDQTPSEDLWEELYGLANQIPKEVLGINRVVHASGSLERGLSLGITRTRINQESLRLAKKVDLVARTVSEKYGLNRADIISQMPVILTALNFGVQGDRAVGIRPFITEDFMTGEAAVPGIAFPMEAYIELVAELTKIKGIGRILYDLTDKPPGTTEWR